jgi:hypothetical protein
MISRIVVLIALLSLNLPNFNAQCSLVIDSIIAENLSCNGFADGSITVYASGGNGAIGFSGSAGVGTIVSPNQPFDAANAISTSSGSGPTNKWWSPSSCSGGAFFQYSVSQGCPAGSAQFVGNFNGFAGCFLRSPQLNMNGIDDVVVTFDLTNSFSASRPNDRLRFYAWVNNGYLSVPAAYSVNGVSGQYYNFTQAGNCSNITVTIDLSTVPINNRNDFLFYIEANCQYNNCTPYLAIVDNIEISEPAPTQSSNVFSNLGPGSYPISVSDAAGCIATFPNPVVITEPELPQPTVILNGSEISTGLFATYQWFLNSELIVGATNSTLSIASNGIYTVQVTDANNCVGISQPFEVLTTNLLEIPYNISVNPNPFSDFIQLNLNGNIKCISIQIYNMLGAQVWNSNSCEKSISIPTTEFPKGVYSIQILDGLQLIEKKMLIKN